MGEDAQNDGYMKLHAGLLTQLATEDGYARIGECVINERGEVSLTFVNVNPAVRDMLTKELTAQEQAISQYITMRQTRQPTSIIDMLAEMMSEMGGPPPDSPQPTPTSSGV